MEMTNAALRDAIPPELHAAFRKHLASRVQRHLESNPPLVS